MRDDAPDPNTTSGPNERRDADMVAAPAQTLQDGTIPGGSTSDNQRPRIIQGGELPATIKHEEKNGLKETNKLLVDVVETLKTLNRAVVGAQTSLARVRNQ